LHLKDAGLDQPPPGPNFTSPRIVLTRPRDRLFDDLHLGVPAAITTRERG
jgi:hypothetical protein